MICHRSETFQVKNFEPNVFKLLKRSNHRWSSTLVRTSGSPLIWSAFRTLLILDLSNSEAVRNNLNNDFSSKAFSRTFQRVPQRIANFLVFIWLNLPFDSKLSTQSVRIKRRIESNGRFRWFDQMGESSGMILLESTDLKWISSGSLAAGKHFKKFGSKSCSKASIACRKVFGEKRFISNDWETSLR